MAIDWVRMMQEKNGGPLGWVDTARVPTDRGAVMEPLAARTVAPKQDVETMADTSWFSGSQAPATGARETGFGGTYADPGGGWNPWSLYDGREGYDGTAADGWYDANRDSPRWELAGRGLEKDRDRVWRWTLDALGPNPGGQAPDRVKQVFLEQVARLKRDYQANGMDWASSAFAGYDRMPGATGGAVSPGTGATPGGGESVPSSAGSAAAAAAAAMAEAKQRAAAEAAGQAAGQQAGGNIVAEYPLIDTGQGTTGSTGGVGGVGDTGTFAGAMTDKAFRIAQVLKALGLTTPDKRMSYGGSIMSRIAPDIFEAWQETQGLSADPNNIAPKDWGSMLRNFAATYRAPGAMGNFQRAGRNAMSTIMDPRFSQGMEDPELIQLVEAFNALMGIGANDTMRRYRGNLLNEGTVGYLQSPGVDTGDTRYLPYLQGNPLMNFVTGR
jgi:hypothetical protein